MALTGVGTPSSWLDGQRGPPTAATVPNGMIPVAFGGCFGWFHPAAEPTGMAVLLCQPLGRESRWVHRSFRKLADRLAAAGLSTLRFDYPNTGDSCDLSAGEDPLATWRDSVHVAADWLRAQTGAAHLALVGIRFGALLAAAAASGRKDVTALALLAPVVAGRAYVREIKALARVAESADAAGPIELDGLVLTETALQAIGAMAMPWQAAPAAHVLLLEHGKTATAYAATLQDLAVDVTSVPFEGFDDLMRTAVTNQVPDADLDRVVSWLAAIENRHSGLRLPIGPVQSLPEMALRPAGCVESPLSFGVGHRLFGVLCRPASAAIPPLVVIIGNSGGDPHTGISRFAVALARRLATEGVASLRMDFAGLGDSVLGPDDRDGHLYTTDRRGDFAAAIDALAALGFRRFAVSGLCTGAFHALAATAEDKRIGALAIINLPTFDWRKDDLIDLSLQSQLRSSASYRAGLIQRENWTRMVRGDIAIRQIFQVLAHRAFQRVLLRGLYAAERFSPRASAAPRRPRHVMRMLSRRGVKIFVLLSSEDPGIDTLEAHFGRGGRHLTALPGATLTIRSGLDHTLSLHRMRDDAVTILANFFKQVLEDG